MAEPDPSSIIQMCVLILVDRKGATEHDLAAPSKDTQPLPMPSAANALIFLSNEKPLPRHSLYCDTELAFT